MDHRIRLSDATALIEEIIAVCARHGLWLSHEDAHGAFLVERGSTEKWLRDAVDPAWPHSRYRVEGAKIDE